MPEHGMHRAVGSQLIYNRESHESLFLGALTSDRFLTILRLHVAGSGRDPRITQLRSRFHRDDGNGRRELARGIGCRTIASSSVCLSRRARTCPPRRWPSASAATITASSKPTARSSENSTTPESRLRRCMGWWSWTAYYFGLNEGAALTNAAWEAEHLKSFGYNVFHIDEGYQYARGEYTTPDATLFPARPGPGGDTGARPRAHARHLDGALRSVGTRHGSFKITLTGW